jgi:nitrogen fixation protein NifB
MNELRDPSNHPCFNAGVKHSCGRVHLPVATRCNIRCNYCDRRHDCVNESRPGVASAVLTPVQAADYLGEVLEKEPRITVAGIAGPGDPLASPAETLETLRLIKERYPALLICLATNGLALPEHVDALAETGVTHVTVTVNAVDPEIGKQIYAWIRLGKIAYRGREGAELLMARQLEAIPRLKSRGITVKVNMIVIPSVNDAHVEAVARTVGLLGADILNLMPVYPNAGTAFAWVKEPGEVRMLELRAAATRFLPQMHHCTRCRADAAGLLSEDRSKDFQEALVRCSEKMPAPAERPYVAVATIEGVLVNLHLGEAASFQIWADAGDGFRCIEERNAPDPGDGARRWERLAGILGDCRAVLASGIGESPRKVLSESGIGPIVMSGFIEEGLKAVFTGKGLNRLKARQSGGCKAGGCGGDGGGC